jgi:acetoacetate decarboxylase
MTSANSETLSQTTIQSYLGGAFSMPIVSPSTPAPPYRYKDTKVTNIVFVTDPPVIEKLIPPPLKPNPDQLMVFYIGYFQFADFDLPYHEAGLLVPVACEGKPAGVFAVVLYLDQPNPIIGGREVYGWPKLDAEQIAVSEESGKITASVTRYGKQIIKVGFEAQQKVDPIPERPKDTCYLLKLIPSIEKDAPPDVLKLVYTVLDPDVIKELRVGKATLEFGDSPADAFLSKIPVQEIVYGETIVHDFTLGYGEVVVDYLASGQK